MDDYVVNPDASHEQLFALKKQGVSFVCYSCGSPVQVNDREAFCIKDANHLRIHCDIVKDWEDYMGFLDSMD
jgi:hypothetical protein